MTPTTEQTLVSIQLSGNLMAAVVADRREEWLNAWQQGKDVEVSAAGLEGVDAAGLQLLIALRRQTEEGGGRFSIVEAAPGLVDGVRLAGLDGVLGAGSGGDREGNAP